MFYVAEYRHKAVAVIAFTAPCGELDHWGKILPSPFMENKALDCKCKAQRTTTLSNEPIPHGPFDQEKEFAFLPCRSKAEKQNVFLLGAEGLYPLQLLLHNLSPTLGRVPLPG